MNELRIASLEAQLEDALLELSYYKSFFAKRIDRYPAFNLTMHETIILNQLRRSKDISTVHGLEKSIGADDCHSNLIRVHLCRIRKKTGIKIKTHYGVGYSITKETKDYLTSIVRET